MKTEELRAIQAPLKDRYREAPAAALATLKAQGRVGEEISCKIETGKALVACAEVNLAAAATAIDVKLRDAVVYAEGDLDFRGTRGVSKDVPLGFRAIHLSFVLDTDASDDQIATLLWLTERYCVVYQTLRQSPELQLETTRS